MTEMDRPATRFSIGGTVTSGLLLLAIIGIIWLSNTREVDFPASAVFGYGLAAAALLRRSFRPPVGFGRGLSIVAGGMLLGAAARTAEHAFLGGPPGYRSQLHMDLLFLIVGACLVWFGLQPVKRAAARVEATSRWLPEPNIRPQGPRAAESPRAVEAPREPVEAEPRESPVVATHKAALDLEEALERLQRAEDKLEDAPAVEAIATASPEELVHALQSLGDEAIRAAAGLVLFNVDMTAKKYRLSGNVAAALTSLGEKAVPALIKALNGGQLRVGDREPVVAAAVLLGTLGRHQRRRAAWNLCMAHENLTAIRGWPGEAGASSEKEKKVVQATCTVLMTTIRGSLSELTGADFRTEDSVEQWWDRTQSLPLHDVIRLGNRREEWMEQSFVVTRG